jgi:CheY-like chemotaxis protein
VKIKILVVDDEAAVCNMLKKFLSKKGHQVTTALSGKEAIKKISETRPHIVFLDIRMPEMDGVETLKRIREIDKEIGVVMITAFNEQDTGKKCIELGAYDYVTKPLDLDYLETVVMIKLIHFGLWHK